MIDRGPHRCLAQVHRAAVTDRCTIYQDLDLRGKHHFTNPLDPHRIGNHPVTINIVENSHLENSIEDDNIAQHFPVGTICSQVIWLGCLIDRRCRHQQVVVIDCKRNITGPAPRYRVSRPDPVLRHFQVTKLPGGLARAIPDCRVEEIPIVTTTLAPVTPDIGCGKAGIPVIDNDRRIVHVKQGRAKDNLRVRDLRVIVVVKQDIMVGNVIRRVT